MAPFVRPLTALSVGLGLGFGHPSTLWAENFRHITAEPSAGAKIDDAGGLKEGKVSFRAIYKPTPIADWCRKPWIDSSEAFRGKHSIGMEILGQQMTDKTEVDKVN